MVHGMKTLGGVSMNYGKLRMIPVATLPAVRVTAKELEDYTAEVVILHNPPNPYFSKEFDRYIWVR
eukprot:COSAG02_NODE_4738_length_5037_cov_3.804172_5_plen_66_part_00